MTQAGEKWLVVLDPDPAGKDGRAYFVVDGFLCADFAVGGQYALSFMGKSEASWKLAGMSLLLKVAAFVR